MNRTTDTIARLQRIADQRGDRIATAVLASRLARLSGECRTSWRDVDAYSLFVARVRG